MKKLMVSMQQKLKTQDDKIIELSNQVTKLAHVNLKLNADNKVLRKDQDELRIELHKMRKQ